jgi:diguanylate cyclase (GGDEF)-like protein
MMNIDTIIERLRRNEEITKKFHEIETRILTIVNFRDLFEVLLVLIKEKFNVPYVWISLIDQSEVSSLIQSLETSESLKEKINIIAGEKFLGLIDHRSKPLLANQDMDPFKKLLPSRQNYFIKSIAIAPISMDGEIIGSLNQADFSRSRFQPGIDTSRLEQLAVMVSLCLSNVTAHEKLKYLAFHDPLTGLLNRRVMETVLKREFNRSRRYAGILSVVFLDLDDFKGINDRYGHDRGDEVLKHVAKTLLEMSRDSDVVARFAGDEFVYILPETSPVNAENLMNRIRDHLKAHPLKIEDTLISISISFGVAAADDDQIETADHLLKKADEMLYKNKERRKSRGE